MSTCKHSFKSINFFSFNVSSLNTLDLRYEHVFIYAHRSIKYKY